MVLALAVFLLLFLTATSLLFLKNKESILWISIGTAFFPLEYIDRYFVDLPSLVAWIPQLVLIYLAALAIYAYWSRVLLIPKKFVFAYAVFVILSLFSVLFNKSSWGPAIYAQRGIIFIFCYIFIFRGAYNKLTLDELLSLTVKIGILSFAVAVIQRILVTLTGETGDMVTGLFSVDNQYLYFQCFCFIIVMAFWFYKKKLVSGLSPQNLALIFIISIAIANNKAGIGFLVLIVLLFSAFVGYKEFWSFFGKAIVTGMFIVIGLTIFDAIITSRGRIQNHSDSSFAYLSDPEYFINYMFGEDDSYHGIFSKSGALRRGSAIVFGYQLIDDGAFTLILGKGSGATIESAVNTVSGYLGKRFEGYKIGRSTLSEKLTETGILGFMVFVFFIVTTFWHKYTGYPYMPHQELVKKVAALFIISYTPYENMFITLVNAFIIAVLIYPNLEFALRRYQQKQKENRKASVKHSMA